MIISKRDNHTRANTRAHAQQHADIKAVLGGVSAGLRHVRVGVQRATLRTDANPTEKIGLDKTRHASDNTKNTETSIHEHEELAWSL